MPSQRSPRHQPHQHHAPYASLPSVHHGPKTQYTPDAPVDPQLLVLPSGAATWTAVNDRATSAVPFSRAQAHPPPRNSNTLLAAMRQARGSVFKQATVELGEAKRELALRGGDGKAWVNAWEEAWAQLESEMERDGSV